MDSHLKLLQCSICFASGLHRSAVFKCSSCQRSFCKLCMDKFVLSLVDNPTRRAADPLKNFNDEVLCPFPECEAEWPFREISAAVPASTSSQWLETKTRRHVKVEEQRSKRPEVQEMSSSLLRIQALSKRLENLDKVAKEVAKVMQFVSQRAQELRPVLQSSQEQCLNLFDSRKQADRIGEFVGLLQQHVAAVVQVGIASAEEATLPDTALANMMAAFDFEWRSWRLKDLRQISSQCDSSFKSRLGLIQGSALSTLRLDNSLGSDMPRKKQRKEDWVGSFACPLGCEGVCLPSGNGLSRCSRCGGEICERCRQVHPEGVVDCKDEELKVVAALTKDTRPCPRCFALIHRMEGCSRMFCTQCRTPFNWQTGEVETFGIGHNPHESEFVKSLSFPQRAVLVAESEMGEHLARDEAARLFRDITEITFSNLSSAPNREMLSTVRNFARIISTGQQSLLLDLSSLLRCVSGKSNFGGLEQEIEFTESAWTRVINTVVAKVNSDGFLDLQVQLAAGLLSKEKFKNVVLSRRSAVSKAASNLRLGVRARQDCLDYLKKIMAELQSNPSAALDLTMVSQRCSSILKIGEFDSPRRASDADDTMGYAQPTLVEDPEGHHFNFTLTFQTMLTDHHGCRATAEPEL